MQTAPAVSVTAHVPPSATLVVLGLCAGAVVSAWGWALQGGGGWRHAAGLVGIGVAASWLAQVRSKPASRLRWDGAAWRLASARIEDDGIEGDVTIGIDLGDRLLLRFVPTGRRLATWLPLSRRSVEGDWHALRCALHAGRAAPAMPPSGALGA